MERFFAKFPRYTPKVNYLKNLDPTGKEKGVLAAVYSEEDIYPYETFMYIGFPENTEKCPAVVLVHGAGGHAYAGWVKDWNRRGYAAIAIDTEGCIPDMQNAGCESETDDALLYAFHRGTSGTFGKEIEMSPENDRMQSGEKDISGRWMTHAIAKVILAQNILRADKRVEKVGICGISWGSIISALSVGADKRFDFAELIYGGAYQLENPGFCGADFRRAKEKTYLAENYFSNLSIPTLVLCSDTDTAFSPEQNSRTFSDLYKNMPHCRISVIHGFTHGHRAAWKREEPYIFADSVCRGAKPLAVLSEMQPNGKFAIETHDAVKKAELYYITEPIHYENADDPEKTTAKAAWKCVPFTVENGGISVTIPENAYLFYLMITGERNGKEYVTSSEILHIFT